MRKRVGPRRMEGDRDPHRVQAPLLSPSVLFGVMVLVYVLTAVAQPVSPSIYCCACLFNCYALPPLLQ